MASEQTLDYVLLEDLASSEPAKQIAALTKIIQVANAGKDVNAHWPTILQYCLNNENAGVRRLAYGTLPLCRVPLEEWDAVSSTIASDLCSFDPLMRIAVLGAVPFVPLQIFTAREADAPGQVWIGGGKDESIDVHIAAIGALRRVIFREQFFLMQNLLYDSWNFISDHCLESDAAFPHAFALAGSLFAYASGFERIPDSGMECETDIAEALKPVAAHVAGTLAPHLEFLVETVSALPDAAKAQCVHGLAALMMLNAQSDDNAALGTPLLGDQNRAPRVVPREAVIRIAGREFVQWLESTDAPLQLAAARNLLALSFAGLHPVEGAEWTLASVSTLLNLLRRESFSRDAIDMVIPLIPRLGVAHVPPVVSHLIEAIVGISDRTARCRLLNKVLSAAFDSGPMAMRQPEVVQQIFREQAIATLWRDEKRQALAEELLLSVIRVFEGKALSEATAAAVKFAEQTYGCVAWSVREHSFPVERYIRFLHDLFCVVATSTSVTAEVRATCDKVLRDIYQTILPRIQSDAVSIQVIYLLVRHLPPGDLQAEEKCVPLLTALKSAYLKLEEFDKYTISVAKAHKSGKMAHPSLIERPRPVHVQAALQCLLLLAARARPLIQSVYSIIDEFGRYFIDEHPTYEQLQSLKLRVYSFRASPSPLGEPSLTWFPALSDPVDSPLFSRDDDNLWLGIAKAAARRTRHFPSNYKVVSGQSDAMSVAISHCLNPDRKRITLFVKVKNISSQTLYGGMLYVLTPEHMVPWRSDTQQLSDSILRTESCAKRFLCFTASLVRFAPTRLVVRVCVAVPRPLPERADEASATPTSTPPPTHSPAPVYGDKQRAQTLTHDSTVDSSIQDDEADNEHWPDIYSEPYVVDVFELVDPLPVSPLLFSQIWPRMPASLVEDYAVSADGLTSDVIGSRLGSLPMACVYQRSWSSGAVSSELAYCFCSWFDDVFGLVVTVRQAAGRVFARLQWRCSGVQALSAFYGSLPAVADVLFAGAATRISDDEPANPFFATACSVLAPNVKAQLARWKEVAPAAAQ